MNDTYFVLSSLAMDLKRVALGYHRKSFAMAERFTKEVQLRKNETNLAILPPYMQTIIKRLDKVLLDTDVNQKTEDALMYSTLIQNYVMKNIANPGV